MGRTSKLGRIGKAALLGGALALAALAPALKGGLPGAAHAQEAPPAASTLIKRTITVAGQARTYDYYVSSKADPTGFDLIVYALHDDGQTAEDFAQQSGWMKVAEDNGLVVVFPEAVHNTWAATSGGEDSYLMAVYDDVTNVVSRGAARRNGRDAALFGTWFPFHYLTGEGAGARVAQGFAINHPGIFAALATLNGGPYNADYARGEGPAQNYDQHMHADKAGEPSWRQLKKDTPLAVWLFGTGANPAVARQAEYWKRDDQVAPAGTARNVSGFQTTIYRAPANPSQQVRLTELPAGAVFDTKMAEAAYDFFAHVARWTSSPNGDLGTLMTKDEVAKAFEIHSMDIDGQTFVYYLKLPSSYRKGQSLPLVVSAHGGGFPAWLYLSQVKMHEVGEKEGFITAYIQKGSNNGWKFDSPDGPEARFIQKLIAEVETSYDADSHRIYMQGFSIGSGMTYMMGLAHPELFAAVSPNDGIGAMSAAVEAKIAQNKAEGRRVPAMIIYGDVDTGGSSDGKIPAQGILRTALDEVKAFDHITTPDKVLSYASDTTTPYDVLVPGAKLARAGVDGRYPNGRFEMYQYVSDAPEPLNLFDFIWVKDMAHAQDPREAQLQWDYFKHWRRNDDGSLTYVK